MNKGKKPELYGRVCELKNQGKTNREISRIVGIHICTVGAWLNPDLAKNHYFYRDGDKIPRNTLRPSRTRLPEGELLKRATPIDTRDLTARLLGDPLPSRSALDKRMGR